MRARYAEPNPPSNDATSASVCLNRACSREAIVRSQITCRLWPPPAAHPGTTATTTLGIVRMSRCTSRMCSRPPCAATRAASTVAADPLVAAGAEGPAAVLRGGPVAGQQHTPDVGGHPGVVERPVQLVDRLR